MRRLNRSACALAVALAIVAVSTGATAHGGFWRAYDILIDPTNPDRIALRSDVWALIVTDDGGQSWHWLCAESYEGDSGNAGQRRSMVMLPGGDLVVANLFKGLRRSRGDWCSWEEIETFAGEVVSDVIAAPDDPEHLFVVTSTGDNEGGIDGAVWESLDAAETWAPVSQTLPTSFSPASIRVAPSDPDRIYLAGKNVGRVDVGTIYRSTDRGATWETAEIPVGDPDWSARLLAVHPDDANLVFFWEDNFETGGGDIQPDAIWMSEDGGRSWRVIFQGVGNLPGFELSPDGSTLLVAGPEDGLSRAPLDEAIARGQSAFTSMTDRPMWGLDWNEDVLYAGTDDFAIAGPGEERSSFAVSYDEGRTFDPAMIICGVTLLECPEDSRPATVCPVNFTSGGVGEGNFKEDFIDSERCESYSEPGAEPAPTDAGAPSPRGDVALSPTDTTTTGCGCRMAGSRSGLGGLTGASWAIAVAMAVTRRRRRRQVGARERARGLA